MRANITYALPGTTPDVVVVGGGTTVVYQPPVISAIKTSQENGVYYVEFTTNEQSSASLSYSETPQMNYLVKTVTKSGMATAHRIALPDASTDRLYYFKIEVVSEHGVGAQGDVQTIDFVPPTLTNVHIASITSTSAEIQWQTNEMSSSTVRWGRTPAFSNATEGAGGVTAHDVVVSALKPSTLYFFRVESIDQFGNLRVGNIRGFQTPSANNASGVGTPSNAGVVKQSQNVLVSWQNPTDPNFAFVMLIKNSRAPANYSDGVLVYNGTGQSVTDAYAVGTYYSLWAVDTNGNYSDMITVHPLEGSGNRPLFPGQENDLIRQAQIKLLSLGHFPTTAQISGFFGPVTERAVKKYQQSIGANATGVLTSAEQALLSGNTVTTPRFSRERRRGESGDDVTQLQQFLADFGYFPFDGTPTGYFGPLTENSLTAYQKALRIPTTGRLDSTTIEKIVRMKL